MMLPWQKRPLALNSPRDLPGLALWLDSKDVSSLRNDAGAQPVTTDGIKLASDKSGNSSTNVLCLNVVAGNYGSSPNAAALQITGDIDLRAYLSLVDWTTGGATRYPISKFVGSFAYALGVTSGGLITLAISTTGADAVNTNSTAAVSFANYTPGWIRATRAQTGGLVNFYTSTDGVNWTLLGTGNQVASAGTAIFAGTSALALGSFSAAAAPMTGNLYRAQIYNGIAGTLVFDANFALPAKLAPTFTESSSNAATVTINTSGATGARISGARDLVNMVAASQPILTIAAAGNYLTFDGSNDYLKAASFSLPQPASVYFVGSQVTWTNNDGILDGFTQDSMDLYQNTSSPNITQYAGAGGPTITTVPVGSAAIITAVANGASSVLRHNRGAAATGNSGTRSMNGFTLGANGLPGSFANITAQEVVVFSGAHDKATQDRVIAYLANRNRIALT